MRRSRWAVKSLPRFPAALAGCSIAVTSASRPSAAAPATNATSTIFKTARTACFIATASATATASAVPAHSTSLCPTSTKLATALTTRRALSTRSALSRATAVALAARCSDSRAGAVCEQLHAR